MDNGLIISLPFYPIKNLNEFFVPYGSSLETNIFLKPINPISTSVGEGGKSTLPLKLFENFQKVLTGVGCVFVTFNLNLFDIF